MANLLDYLDWRGDLTPAQAPLCEVDALVFSALSYLPFSRVVGAEPRLLGEAAEALLALYEHAPFMDNENDLLLLQRLCKCKRFSALQLADCVELFDKEAEKQFSALTVLLPEGFYIVYRGTDGTLVGWKEDLNMSFSDCVPAQLDALAYLEQAAARRSGKICVCGHSKGGNLAVYAATFCTPPTQARIDRVLSHDGPGFLEAVIAQEAFQRILPRVHTFAPQTSVVGRLLQHSERYTVVRSNAEGLHQHSLFSWQVLGDRLIEAEGLTSSSDFINETVKRWFDALDAQQRRELIDRLYAVLCDAEAEQVSDLRLRALWRAASGLDKQTRHLCAKALRELFGSAKSAYIDRRKLNKAEALRQLPQP